MKKHLLSIWPMAVALIFSSFTVNGQCLRVGIVGEFSGWGMDLDHEMTRNSNDPNMFTTIITLTEAQDASDPIDSLIELKFRENNDWTVNWGDTIFPSGTATIDGSNLKVPYGTYFVTFDCSTGAYSWTATCGAVGIVGEFSGWGTDPDHAMTRDPNNNDMWSTYITLTLDDDSSDPLDSLIDLKFRTDNEWAINWGDTIFPSGTATADGPNVSVPPGNYFVTFNCATGAYNFQATCGEISIIGELTEWADDIPLTRSQTDPDLWSGIIKFEDEMDTDTSGGVEVKFRQNADWAVNWGDSVFPSGTAVLDGSNITLPVDNGGGLYTEYYVTFNCATGAYSFEATCGDISMIGEFFNWNGDAPMQRMEGNPNMHTLSRSFYADAQGKFRENKDWSVNWGDTTFPAGIATDNGPNINILQGKYDITFNCASGEYNFLVNDNLCGEVGLVGDFNNFGTPEDPENPPTDLYLQRDPNSPNDFTLVHNFTSSTRAIFRTDADVAFVNVWGGNGFPSGTGIAGDPASFLEIAGGSYEISFNCISGDYDFKRLGSAITANKVFAMSVDGVLDEADWDISANISSVAGGEVGDDPNDANFGVVFTDDQLILGIHVNDEIIETGDLVHIFVDGDKNGGDYGDSDIYFTVNTDGVATVVAGNMTATPEVVVNTNASYVVEAAINWADLGVTPVTGGGIGLDIGVTDVDNGTEQATIIWNGNLGNLESASALGDCIFGNLSCGSVSLWSPTIGDVGMNNPTDLPTDYVTTYELGDDMNLFFRKDGSSTVQWGDPAFPMGTATVGGDAIAATAGRYRVAFNCLTGVYSFTDEPSETGVAFAKYSSDPVAIDGDLTEFDLEYGFDAGSVDPVGATVNNTASWGALWDDTNLYIAVQVEDAVVEGSGNPWENDGIELYIDGNHDADGTYDGDFDTQIIMDFSNGNTVWTKADGVPLTADVDVEGNFKVTDNGYNIELRISFAPFKFVAGRNRTLGFTIGMNDSDDGLLGREYQAAWVGTANNWNNTSVFGDLQLAEGPLVDVKDVFFNENVSIFPNPALSEFYISTDQNVFNGDVELKMFDIVGRVIHKEKINFSQTNQVQVNTANLTSGQYFVHLIDSKGQRAIKKLMVE